MTVMGSTSNLLEVRRLEVQTGRFLPPIDPDRTAPVAVIGRTVQRELFRSENPLGRPIRIGDWRFRVIGVMGGKGHSLGVDMDDVVIIPVASAMRIFDQSSLFRVIIEVSAHAEIEAARHEVAEILKERHDDEEDVTIITQDSVLATFKRIFGALTLGLAGIAGISLSVAGIGVMNVMLVSVSERTAEIGLLKALGARPGSILRVFLVEAVLLSLAGGGLGLLAGYVGTGFMRRVLPALPAAPPAWAVAAALAVSFGAGIIFGVLPARRASRLDPVSALARR
jgi:putative ABC transport system permease protein